MTTLAPIAVEEVAIDDLRPDPANPRRIGDDELDTLERSLRQFGFVQPVLARREDRTVIGGHQRLLAARRLGYATVPVTWLDVSVDQARVLGLALNKISGTWDEPLLARLLAELQEGAQVDLSLTGFDEDEVRDLIRSLETRERRERPEAFDLAEALDDARRSPRAKRGELWRLGDHRLLCGDATDADDVARALPSDRDRPGIRRRRTAALGAVQRRRGGADRWLRWPLTMTRSCSPTTARTATRGRPW